MTEIVKNGFRRSVPATSAVCLAELAELRKQVEAKYARQHSWIQETGHWFTGLPTLFIQYGSALYSLWRLRSMFAQEGREEARQYHLERILAFISA